jgi:hypothetical protein
VGQALLDGGDLVSKIDEQNYHWVQFCPCGCTQRLHIDEIRKLQGVFNSVDEQLDKIDKGIKLDALIFHSSDCPSCQEDGERQDRLTAAMLDW